MKRILGIVFTLFLGLALVACGGNKKPTPPAELTDKDIITAARTQLNLGTEDALKNINSDFDLPTITRVSDKEVAIAWESNNEDSIKVETNKAKVTLIDKDVEVKLTATLTYNEEETIKEFNLVVLAEVVSENQVATIYDAIEYAFENNSHEELIEVTGEVIVIATGSDGFVVADDTSALLVFQGTGVEVGDIGHITGIIDVPFGTNPNFGRGAQFVKTGAKATDAEIKALAKTRSIEEQLAKPYADYDSMGFFKMNGKIVTKTVGGNENPYLVSLEDDANEFVHYYKLSTQNDWIALGKTSDTDEGVDVYVFIYDYHSGEKVYRVGFYTVDVAMSDELIVDGVVGNLKDDFAKNSLAIEGDIEALKFTNSEVAITWAFTDAEDANNAFVNLDTKKVVGNPTNGQKVKLTATLKLGDVTKTVDFVLGVGLPEVAANPVDAILNGTVGDIIAVQGKIVMKQVGGYNNYFFVDGDREAQVFITFSNAGELVDIVKDAADTNDEVFLVGRIDKYQSNPNQLSAPFFVVRLAD